MTIQFVPVVDRLGVVEALLDHRIDIVKQGGLP
jgi:hypothetical protein